MCLNKFKEKYPEYNHISDEWFTWFIGFFEGDGCFMIGSKNLELIITQREDNKVILEEIQKTLNIGKVIIQTKHIVPGRYWIYRFIVRDYIGIGILLDLFKDNLILPVKVEKYNEFIDKYNIKIIQAKKNRPVKYKKLTVLNKIELRNTLLPSKNDSWLSGFIDAEGCFYSNIIFIKNRPRVRILFDICQKDYGNKNIDIIFEHIKKNIFNNSGILSEHSVKGIKCLRVIKGLENVYDYLDSHPLKTTKFFNYLFQKEINIKFRNKDHLDENKLYNMMIFIKTHKDKIGKKGMVLRKEVE